jgi:hypothetical protein
MRTWKTGDKIKSAWVTDYLDQAGKRRRKTFPTRKAADAWFRKAKSRARSMRVLLIDFSDKELLAELLRRARARDIVDGDEPQNESPTPKCLTFSEKVPNLGLSD